jgi:hypothetical protein
MVTSRKLPGVSDHGYQLRVDARRTAGGGRVSDSQGSAADIGSNG